MKNCRRSLQRIRQRLAFGLGLLDRRCRKVRGAVVVCLHGVAADGALAGVADTIAERVLEKQIRWMRTIGPIVPIEEMLHESCRATRFSIVFDDATASVARIAAPYLRAADVPWSVAVPTDFVGSGRPLWIRDFEWILRRSHRPTLSVTWASGSAPEPVRTNGGSAAGIERFRWLHFSTAAVYSGAIVAQVSRQLGPDDPAHEVPEDIRIGDLSDLRACVDAGATLISHGARHLPLQHLPSGEVVAEWRNGRDWLLANFPRATLADTLVAPYGRAAPHAVPELRDAGCRFVLTGVNGIADETIDPYRIPRIPGASESVAGFAARVARHLGSD